jgi:exopolysaccharide production protein ExoQ
MTGVHTLAGPRTSVGQPPTVIVWLVIFISVTAVLLGGAGSAVGAYVFLALWVVLGGFYARTTARMLTSYPAVWLFPGFALLSTLWSQAFGSTLKFGAEFAGTVGCAILAAALVTPRQMISALMCCLLVTAILSIAFGTSLVDPMSGVTSFVGLFASKNQLGFFVSVMLLGSLATMFDKGQPRAFRLLGFLALGVEAPLLVMTRSGTADVTAALAAGVLIANVFVSRLSRFGRARLFFACVVIMLPSLALLGVAGDGLNDFIVKVMGKDTTLTGRTVLWQHAATLIPSHPMLGLGFQAFWRQNEVEAESLWNQFHILGRAGFHFHNTYIEATIELGYIGAALLAATVLSVMVGVLRWSWRTGSVAASFFVALMACLLIRSFVEVDMMFQFQIGTFLLFVAAYYACRRPSGAGR